MTAESRSDVSTLLGIFLLQRSSYSESAREGAISHLAEIALSEVNGTPVAQSVLSAKMSEILGISGDLPQDLLDGALARCTAAGTVFTRSGAFLLSRATKEAVREAWLSVAEDEAHFDEELALVIGQLLGQPLSVVNRPLLATEVKKALAAVLGSASVEIHYRADSSPYPDVLDALQRYAPLDLLQQSLDRFVRAGGLTNVREIESAVRTFLGNMDEQSQRYITALHNKVFYHQILNVDPQFRRVEKAALEQCRMYLDTNVVLDAILDELRDSAATQDLLNGAKRLGIQLFVSPATLEEIGRQIQAAEGRLDLAKEPAIATAIRNDKYNWSVSAFLVAFLRRRERLPGLTWQGFIAIYRDMEGLLLDKDILTEKEGFENIDDDELYDEVWQSLSQIRANDSRDNVIHHDTQNFVLIHRLRQRYGDTILFGPAVWLLTHDHHLEILDRRMMKVSDRFVVRHSLRVDDFGRLLMPYQNVLDFTFSDYPTLLIQSRLGITPRGESLDLDFLESLRHPDIDLGALLELSEEHAADILISLQRDKYIRELAETIRESTDDEEKARAQAQVAAEILAKVARQRDELSQQLEKLIQELKSAKDDRRAIAMTLRIIQTELSDHKLHLSEAEIQMERLQTEIQEGSETRRQDQETIEQLEAALKALRKWSVSSFIRRFFR